MTHPVHRTNRMRGLLGRLDAWTLWAFNAPAELTTRRTPDSLAR